MLIKQAPDIPSSEITPEHVYYNRRQFIGTASGAALGAAGAAVFGGSGSVRAATQDDIPDLQPSPFSTDERLNSYEEITSYNNFYEFGLDKEDPRRYADDLTVEPWRRAGGGPHQPARGRLHPEDILQPHPLEERIYRLRCVEAWSMVVPWSGSRWATSSGVSSRLAGSLHPVRDALSSGGVPRPAPAQPRLSLRRGTAHGRGDESLAILAVGLYGKTLSEPERRADSTHRTVEVRLQEHQVDRQDPVRRGSAAEHLERGDPQRVRLLRQRQPGGEPPAVVSGDRAPDRELLPAADGAVQRVRRPGGRHVQPPWTWPRTTEPSAGARSPSGQARARAARRTGRKDGNRISGSPR